jgi:hypothetical protein
MTIWIVLAKSNEEDGWYFWSGHFSKSEAEFIARMSNNGYLGKSCGMEFRAAPFEEEDRSGKNKEEAA